MSKPARAGHHAINDRAKAKRSGPARREEGAGPPMGRTTVRNGQVTEGNPGGRCGQTDVIIEPDGTWSAEVPLEVGGTCSR